MDKNFPNQEKLFRAVRPPEKNKMYWKKDGTLSSAVFKDSRGVSVERSDLREDSIVISYMERNFEGNIISVNVGQCREVKALVKYLPSNRSIYHSEIHRSNSEKLLTKKQQKMLARCAIIER